MSISDFTTMLPDVLTTTNIFTRLEADNLARASQVSQHWHALVTNNPFIKLWERLVEREELGKISDGQDAQVHFARRMLERRALTGQLEVKVKSILGNNKIIFYPLSRLIRDLNEISFNLISKITPDLPISNEVDGELNAMQEILFRSLFSCATGKEISLSTDTKKPNVCLIRKDNEHVMQQHCRELGIELSQFQEEPMTEVTTEQNATLEEKAFYWSYLPEEIRVYIFSFLTIKTLGIAASVCTEWEILSRDTSLWNSLIRADDISPTEEVKIRTCEIFKTNIQMRIKFKNAL